MIAIKILLTFFLAYLFLCLYLYLFQEKKIFFPPPSNDSYESIPEENNLVYEINGLRLEGIYSGKLDNTKPVVIYFGGNAEDVFYNYPDFKKHLNAQFVAFNYRGFSRNEGKPTVDALLQDSDAIIEKIITEFSLDTRNIVLMGRSFGAAIAMQLSNRKEYAGIILISPFDSMENIAKRYFPWMPISLLLKHRLDSYAIAKQSDIPLLILAASNDDVIPIEHSKVLYDAWLGENKQIEVIENAGHNTISNAQRYFSVINHYINENIRID